VDTGRETHYTIDMNRIHAKNWKVMLAVIFLCFTGQQLLYGASKTSAASFLKLPVSADAIALGGNAVAMGNGSGSVAANPAALGFIGQHEFQASYGSHLEGYKFFNAAMGRSGGSMNTGLSVTRIAADDFEGRDGEGAPTGGFGASDMALNLSAAKAFRNFSFGMNVKYIASAIENESASAIAVDAGLVFLGDKYAAYPYRLGVSIRNLGTPMKYMSKSEPLPLTAAAALSMTIAGPIEAGVNVSNNLTENVFEFGVGMGLNVADSLSLTGGLSRELGSAADADSMPFRLTAGVGFKVADFMLNYGFVPMGELGNVQRMSVTFKFGERSYLPEKTRSGTGKYSKTANKKNWKF